MKIMVRGALSALILGSFGAAANAADLPFRAPAPTPFIAPDTFEPWQIHIDASGVVPGNGGALHTTPGSAFISNGFKASYSIIPSLDIGYFFTKNIAVELFCCESPHNLFLKGGPLANTRVANSTIFPPTLFLNYHFTNFGQFQPYIGVGVNYTHYFSPTPNQAILDSVTVRDNVGIAAQIGVDYMLTEHWGINANVKWVEMDPPVRALLADGVTHLTGNAKLDPWLFSGGITYRFGGSSQPIFAKY